MKTKNTKQSNSKKVWVVIGVVFFFFVVVATILAAAYNSAAQTYALGVDKMRSGVEDAVTGVLKPLDGVERQKTTVTNGDLSQSFFCIDVSCPQIETRWSLLADNGQENAIESKIRDAILQKSGNEKWSANVIVGAMGKNERPSSPTVGKDWFSVTIFVTR